MRRALLLALLVLAAAPAVASAHAVLQESTPARGASVETAPAEVTLRFSEPVEASFGAVRVFDGAGKRVEEGEPFRPAGSSTVGVKLRPGLPDGAYTVTFRVISADSHPVQGGFVFSVGEGGATNQTVDEFLQGSSSGPVTSVAFGAARAVFYAALALGLGTLAFLVLCWLPGLRGTRAAGGAWDAADAAFTRRARRLLLVASALGAASAALAILLQGATARGVSLWEALDATTIGDVLGTRFGVWWGLGLLGWLVVSSLAAAQPRRLQLTAVPLALLAAVPGLGGHAGTQDPVWLILPLNIVHVLAMGAWIGGIAVAVLALRSATSELAPAERSPLLAAVLTRFSALATVAVGVVLLTGVVQSLASIDAISQLVETGYGRAVLAKFVLFCGLCALGYANRSRHLPRLRASAAAGETAGAAGATLRSVLRAELAIGIVVLGITGALATYAPADTQAAGPFSGSAVVGQARIDVTVEPAAVGANELHVYLFDRASGAQYDEAEEVRMRISLPEKDIAPLDLDAKKAGPGHYTVSGAPFGVAGDWKLDVAVRVSDFDEFTTDLEIPIE